MRILGMDEAGRGCVLGPLVVGAYCVEAPDEAAAMQPLAEAGADDSKALSHKKRVKAREALRPLGQIELFEIEPAAIDAGNINTLEEEAFLQAILHFDPDLVYIDAPVHPRGIPAFQARLSDNIRRGGGRVPRFVIEPKADANYPVVGAASIFAKVQRDARIDALHDNPHGPVGSGYPSDPVTRAWLTGFLSRGEDLPACVRTRWGTIDNLRQMALFG
jgi:ribonuclease HII